MSALCQWAREARGLKVEEIAQTLKLGIRQIEAIEADRWETLPGRRSSAASVPVPCARLVQIDAAPMAQPDGALALPADTLAGCRKPVRVGHDAYDQR